MVAEKSITWQGKLKLYLVGDPITKLFFALFQQPDKYIGKVFTGCLDTPLQSIRHGRISREGLLVVREIRDRSDKILPKKTRSFGLKF